MSEEMPKYTAKELEVISNGANYISSKRIGIFEGEKQIGEYVRNYSSFGTTTFFPFEQDGKWYALYSKDYTCTSLMSLPDCKHIGGEEPNAAGFCPVEFYVPELTGQIIRPEDPKPLVANHDAAKWATIVEKDGYQRYYWPDDKDGPDYSAEKEQAYTAERERTHLLSREWHKRNPFVTRHAKFAFVAGCIWGDDGSWKIEFIDLSRASEGIIKRDGRFGYIELPSKISLREAIDCDSNYVITDDLSKLHVNIALPVRFDMTGKRYKEDE